MMIRLPSLSLLVKLRSLCATASLALALIFVLSTHAVAVAQTIQNTDPSARPTLPRALPRALQKAPPQPAPVAEMAPAALPEVLVETGRLTLKDIEHKLTATPDTLSAAAQQMRFLEMRSTYLAKEAEIEKARMSKPAS